VNVNCQVTEIQTSFIICPLNLLLPIFVMSAGSGRSNAGKVSVIIRLVHLT
jgi:GTP-binding protein EngB required for normal cell division